MATKYRIQIGDEIIEFEGPDDLTDAQIQKLGDTHLKEAKPGQEFPPSVYVGDVIDPSLAPEQAKAQPEVSELGSFVRSAPRDALFNFDDEIAAYANAGIPGLAELDNAFGIGGEQQGPLDGGDFWERVKNNQRQLQELYEADEAQNPKTTAVSRIGGVLATLPKAAVTAAARLPQAVRAGMAARPILTTATLGGAAGAASGAGAGEEGTRGQSAALAGMTGFGLGPASYAAGELAPVIANYARIFFGKGSDREAIGQIVKALKRDGYDVTSPTGIQKVKAALQEFTGKPVSLADIGGAMRARAGVGLRTPSDAQQPAIDAIRQRQAGQGQRLAADIRANVAPRTDVHALDDDLVAQRASDAQRLRELALYEEAPTPQLPPIQTIEEAPNAGLRRAIGMEDNLPAVVEPPVPVPPGGRQSRVIDPLNPNYTPEQHQAAVELQNLARLPDAQRALTAALERAEAERTRLAALGQDTSHLPDLTRGSDLDVRTFDWLKRYLDDEVNALYRRGQGSTFSAGEVAQVRALRDDIRDRLRVAVPEYGDYLDQYAGSSEMIDALREGQDFTKLSPEQITGLQSRRSQAGQELYRVGAARNLLDTIMETKDTGNAASRILNSPESRNQLLATGVDPANAAALNRSVSQERTLNLLPQELAGAQTAQRAMSQADANAGIEMTLPFNPGSPLGWLGMAGRFVRDRASLARNEAVNAELMPRVTTTDPAALENVLRELEARGDIINAARVRRQIQAQRNALLGGNVIGAPVSLQPQGE